MNKPISPIEQNTFAQPLASGLAAARPARLAEFPVMRTLGAKPHGNLARPAAEYGAVLLLHLYPSAVAAAEVLLRLGMSAGDILFVGKDYRYRNRDAVEAELRRMGVTLAPVAELREALAAYSVRLGDKPFVVIEDGGHVALEVYRDAALLARCKGFVEQTSKGIWRVKEKIAAVTKPHLSLPDSIIKREFEGSFVAEAAVSAIKTLLMGHAQLHGLKAAVLGSAGVIGTAVAAALTANGADVTVYDRAPPPYYELKMYRRARVSTSLTEALHDRDLVVGCTGSAVFGLADIRHLKDGVVLASTGSEQTEFPLALLAQLSETVEPFKPADAQQAHGSIYRLAGNGKRIVVLEDGRPVNLGLAGPDKEAPCFDLIMALLVAGGIELMKGRFEGRAGFINEFDDIASAYNLAEVYTTLHQEAGQ